MAGTYTDRRPVAHNVTATTYLERGGGIYPDSDQLSWHERPFTLLTPLPGEQVVTSFRTRGGVDQSEQELKDSARVLRNGFTTFNPQFDHGHAFYTSRVSSTVSHPYYELWRDAPDSRRQTGYKGPLVPYGRVSDFELPNLAPWSVSDYKLKGQRAINATSPIRPQANAATTIGELLLEGLPTIMNSTFLKDMISAGRGGMYLKSEFGWKPFLSDLRSIVSALMKANATIKQLQRDNGRNVRRRFYFPQVTSVTTRDSRPTDLNSAPLMYGGYSRFWNLAPQDSAAPWNSYQITESVSEDIWFSGCFTYCIPMGDSLLEQLGKFEAMANVILGTRVTPEVLWELTPWSWLIDWRLGIGEALTSASAFSADDLVLRYGYLMRRRRGERLISWLGRPVKGPQLPLATRIRWDVKERVRATPYGFGLNLDTFSVDKWTVLTALGITQGANAKRA